MSESVDDVVRATIIVIVGLAMIGLFLLAVLYGGGSGDSCRGNYEPNTQVCYEEPNPVGSSWSAPPVGGR
ncbi:hypothetical protein LCGC14_1915630 [marine sediment metagenome]|uniref:Uncharacterized protein n=1 Tax=marine sediment metagenome TaxID=412755 RepID=A0A0F9FT20_9ZZZZ